MALPQSHGLRASIERHKARLTSEFTRARLRRKVPTVEALRDQINAESDAEGRHPRWIRINTLQAELELQLAATFVNHRRVLSVQEVLDAPEKSIYIDEHIPNLVAVSPGMDFTKTEAYLGGAIILQDKASCFPAYLLDPHAEDGDVIDSCAAPGNKTTHLAAILRSHRPEMNAPPQRIFAFEKDVRRAKTLEKMVKVAGSKSSTRIGLGQDFLKVNPADEMYRNVGALLLDPSCSGSGIVGRDTVPELHLPDEPGASSGSGKKASKPDARKRKRDDSDNTTQGQQILMDDDGNETVVATDAELKARLEALSTFQLALLLHAFRFPAAKKVTYSTCSIHAEENEQVVEKALDSDIAKQRGWRILTRGKQVRGMREWPVRGISESSEVAEGCIRAYKGDGRGVMGFFVAGFVRDSGREEKEATGKGIADEDYDGPFVRDEDGRIIRDMLGMPILKSTGEVVSLPMGGGFDGAGEEDYSSSDEEDEEEEDDDDDDDGDEDEDEEDSDEDYSGDESNGDEEWGGIED
jgi:25S rRNA (cytosine2278-C5)-methyltransferase